MNTSGGYLKEVPLPHRHRWPDDPTLRRVRISISRYYGYGPHYHVHATEEDNPIWDSRDAASWGRPGKPMGWRACWDDEVGKGRDLYHPPLKTHARAMRWVQLVVALCFPGDRYDIQINDCEYDGGTYHYKYEGD